MRIATRGQWRAFGRVEEQMLRGSMPRVSVRDVVGLKAEPVRRPVVAAPLTWTLQEVR